MPCFNSIRKKANCFLGSNNGISQPILRRRMGISSSGTTVTYDDYGEPLTTETDIYNDLTIYGTIQKLKFDNDENSNIGGRPDKKREKLDFLTSSNTDVIQNDLLEYPINSNNWFKVDIIEPNSGLFGKSVIAFHEVRSTQ